MIELQLLREFRDYKDLEIVKEDFDGQKKLYITGPFLQGNIKNRNERIYPTDMLESSIKKYVETKVRHNRALGELNHPPGIEINLNNVSHRIVELKMVESNGVGKALILDTPKGQIARALIEGGCNIGVSTRGLGKLDENKQGVKLVSEFDLVTVDIVAEPSAPDAYVKAINEGLKYYIDEKTNDICALPNNQKQCEMQMIEKVYRILEEIKEGLISLPKKQEQKEKTIIDVLRKSIDKI
jgi:hypothetical protein